MGAWQGRELMRQALLLSLLLVAVTLAPVLEPVQAAESDDLLVCCDASPVELYLLGSDSNKKLTPFASELGEEPQSVSLETSISSQESIGRWVLPDTWGGAIPASTWTFSLNYEVSNAAGVQINATATVNIGSKSFSAQTDPGSFLAQGTGSMTFEIEVEAMTTSGSSNIELEMTAQAVVFSVPGADAKLEFLWGSEDDASSLEATIPIMDILMVEPEVEGSDVYLAVRLDSPWGLSTLAMAESISLKVNGREVAGDPIETASGDMVRVTWTWTEAAGGVEVISVEVELVFQQDQPSLKGSATFEIETFDSGGGTGTYYPPDEPLRTDGDGSGLVLDIDIALRHDSNGLLLERVTTMEIGDELAFWMRWGMDHIGDDNPALSSTLRAFSAGAVTDEDRVSRFIEDVELAEFERQLVTLGPMYMNAGLGLDTEELLGDFRSFNELKVEVDLNGKNAVINHPVTLRFSTTQLIADGERFDLLRNFIVVQPAPLWSDITIELSARSGALNALSSSILRESDAFEFSVSRLPWGDSIRLSGTGIDQNEKFTLATLPTTSLVYAPLSLTVLTLVGLIGAFVAGLALTKERRRTSLYVELVLVPVVLLITVLGYPPLFIGIALGATALIWWVTGVASPRLVGPAQRRGSSVPTIPCPACQTPNAVTTAERPHRFNCKGCQRVIKLVA
jgi:hypothetical protein